MAAESSSSTSWGSLSSLTAGDVLVRSAGAHGGKGSGGGGCGNGVAVCVTKLREAVPSGQTSGVALGPRETSCVPPAVSFSSNRDSSCSVADVTPCSAAPGVWSTKGHPEHLLLVEDPVEAIFVPQMDYPKEAAGNPKEAGHSPEDSRRPKNDVLISRYPTGQKEALRAALKQKTRSAPVFKEVKVQLLGNASPERKEGVGQDPRSMHREADSATTIAAATAAAIATTAPLLKVQNDLQAKVNSVSTLLHKLQETERQLQRVAEQQTNTKTQHEKPHCQERVKELEKQMNAFMLQRIHHLEKLQEHQMSIQSHFFSSAVNMGGLQETHMPSSGLMTKQSEKAEQQLLNSGIPSSQKSFFPSGGLPTQGDGRQLEHLPNPQVAPWGQMESSEKTALTNDKMSWHSEIERPTALQTDPCPAYENSSQNCNSIEKTVKKADDLLQVLGQLRKEMHDVLQDANTWKSDMNDLIKGEETSPAFAVSTFQSKPTKTIASDPPELNQLVKPSVLQNVKEPESILSDARRVLREVQSRKKVLEENLEAILRAKGGGAMSAFINALTTNRDALEKIRIRKAVDEKIKAISAEIQAEMARNDMEQVKYDQKVPWIKRAQNIKAMKNSKEIKAKTQKIQGCSTKKPLSAAKLLQNHADDNKSKLGFRTYFSSESLRRNKKGTDEPVSGCAVVQNEEYLSQVYGKPIYQGHRSTLKKAPYLRFNSPSPKSKLQRPRVIECVRGTKVKSAGTQTCSHARKAVISSKKQHPLYALAQENQYFFSPSRDVPADRGPLEGHLIPMAIPLGQTQLNDISVQPAAVVTCTPHPVTVTTSVPQVPPKPPAEVKKPNIAVIEMRSEKKDPPQLSVQVLPNVDIDSVSSGSVSADSVLPEPEPALCPADAVIQAPEDLQSEEEDMKFPGTHFIDVTDVMQDQEEERDEIPEFTEPLLEINGHFKVAVPTYNGPSFPPVASAPQQSSDVLDEWIERRETIENRLINWVEQEIMAKIISEMYPVRRETVPSVSTSEGEDSETVTSDIVEAAGGGGFQLFIDAGVPVDSEMISHLVNEVLSETIATMLGNRQAQEAVPATNVLPSTTAVMEPLVPTPLPTPQATPPQTPPSEKEMPPVKTPESSPSITELSEDAREQEKMKEAGSDVPAAVNRVGTPVITPISTPPEIITPSPPASEAAKMENPAPPDPWDDAELPLEEEKPSPLADETFNPKAVEMSVANDEEPEALILPSWQSSPKPFQSLPCEPQVPSPAPTDSSEQSTQESSPTLTETETADRPISEGEVLFSCDQMLAAREGGLPFPNPSESLTSTLQDANEMDYDPPSEGQVVRRSHKGYHRDPVLALLAKLNQAPVAVQEGRYHLEDSDDSAGELSEGQRPLLSRAAERILVGHPVDMDHATARTSEDRPYQGSRSPSPGQLVQAAEILGDADTSHGPMLVAELESQPISNPVVQAAQPSCRVASLPKGPSQEESQGDARVVRPRVVHVRRKSEEMQEEGESVVPHLHSHVSAERMSVKLPSMNIDDQTQSISSIHGDSDSSGADTF
ncbi:protein TALPID3 isoform X2 [Centrocercus urophasianus]|uniref:protein TALPID3 isoform X2 n=1 Tax=Centrocercus urophasianus TaxID=9002 RepID=UPI001C64608B|nr:protein TALPID3 isoform X2 [Centrocercus urophasianus]